MNFEGYLKTANQLYKDKYTYSNYPNLFSKVTITCPLHGDFERIGIYHIYGDECPTCQHGKERIYYNYVMQSGGIIKIGRSANVFARMSELSFNLGRTCLLHNVFAYNSRHEAWDSERFAHAMFKKFNISPFDLKFAGSSEFFKILPSMACNSLIISGGKLVYEHH